MTTFSPMQRKIARIEERTRTRHSKTPTKSTKIKTQLDTEADNLTAKPSADGTPPFFLRQQLSVNGRFDCRFVRVGGDDFEVQVTIRGERHCTVGIPSRGIIISYVERATISADLVNTRAKRETAAAAAAVVALRDYARNHIEMPPLRFNGSRRIYGTREPIYGTRISAKFRKSENNYFIFLEEF